MLSNGLRHQAVMKTSSLPSTFGVKVLALILKPAPASRQAGSRKLLVGRRL